MLKRRGMRTATGLVAVCVIAGMVGIVKSQSFVPPQQTLERVAAFVTSTILTKLQLQIAGAAPSLGHTLFLSAKSEASVQENQPAEGTEDAATDDGQALPESKSVSEPGTGKKAEQDPEPDAGVGADMPAAANVPVTQVKAAAAPADTKSKAKPAAASTDRKVAFIYHSHNRESWLPELKGTNKDKPNEAFDDKINVSLLGARLQKQLEGKGIGAIHSDADYNTAVPSFNYNYSYKYSKTTVKEALAVHKELTYLFDIHRDSQRRKNTTVTIDGVDYAKMYFIIGQGNANWKENEAFAQSIHEAMNDKLPGISKGILTKGAKHGHGEYNQSLSSSSVLIEIGGVDNTLKESNRTIDALASVIAELVMEAEMVDAPAPEKTERGEKASAAIESKEITTAAAD